MTAPTKNRSELHDVGSRDQSGEPRPGANANNLAVERVTHFLDEIVAKGVLPAL